MITNHDRSRYFGASDASKVVGNWETPSFKQWWLEKMGLRRNTFTNKAMKTGTWYEHLILDTIEGVRQDFTITIEDLRIRVNYDGDKDGIIYEVKTHNIDKPFKVSKAYWRQAQVEMYAMNTRELYIVSYGLTKKEYMNYFSDIEPSRIVYTKIEYDAAFIEEYLADLKILRECLIAGTMPKRAA
jgi:hypothetical protein